MSSMKFSAYAEDCFLIKLFSVPARSEVLLDLLLTKEKTCFVISWLVITKADVIKILRTLEFSKVQKVSTSTKVLEKQT